MVSFSLRQLSGRKASGLGHLVISFFLTSKRLIGTTRPSSSGDHSCCSYYEMPRGSLIKICQLDLVHYFTRVFDAGVPLSDLSYSAADGILRIYGFSDEAPGRRDGYEIHDTIIDTFRGLDLRISDYISFTGSDDPASNKGDKAVEEWRSDERVVASNICISEDEEPAAIQGE